MIVVDTNVLAYLYLPGEYTIAAESLLEQDPEWAAPILWRSEFRNILAGYPRRKSLTFDQACSLQREAESHDPLRVRARRKVCPSARYAAIHGPATAGIARNPG